MRTFIATAWKRVEAEHFILAGAYVGASFIGHESTGWMAAAYGAVGTVHAVHVKVKPNRDPKTGNKNA